MSTLLNQITIPDFDDDDLTSTPIPFGRTGFGSFSAQDSPTVGTPTHERHGFFHSRGDSENSVDSAQSFQYGSARSASMAYSSQTSLPSTLSAPATPKKSFASIRNAFKSSKNSDPPPVPQLDRQAYPSALRNPFNRSNSSLAQVHPSTVRKPAGPSSSSPTQYRPSTPGASYSESRNGRIAGAKSKGHSYERSQHSNNGSIFNSDGSDTSHQLQLDPPPVPRVPNAFRTATPPLADLDDRVMPDPRTPSDYALHAVFMQFASRAESKIREFLQLELVDKDKEPYLPKYFGPDVDPKFDDILNSLGRVAIKHTKAVVESVLRWRKEQNEAVGEELVNFHARKLSQSVQSLRVQSNLQERKVLASIYIMCRALIAVVHSAPKDALADAIGYDLEESAFEQFKHNDTRSANLRVNNELFTTLLGELAIFRFVSVTDRYLAELRPVASGLVPKDLDPRYENIVRGLRHVKIKVYPYEYFEDCAEFLDTLSKSFANAHGSRFKITFNETLTQILHSVGKAAQDEVNNPMWAKGIEVIYARARDMMQKPRYWPTAYPLVITSLCVAPQEFFLKHWVACFEAGLPKLKEKPSRTIVLNGLMRLVWTYLYRSHEAKSTATSKLETLFKYLFPANRTNFSPLDDHLDIYVYIVHFVLSKHFEFGRDFALNLMQEQSVRSTQLGNVLTVMAPERTSIALEAILLSLHLLELEQVPSWPSTSDFTALPTKSDYPSSAEFCPPSIMSKPGMQEFFDRCGTTVAFIAQACYKSVGRMFIFDDRFSAPRIGSPYDEPTNYLLRQHPEILVAYPVTLSTQLSTLSLCYNSWPRCLHPSLPLEDALDMLICGLINVEPSVCEAASESLQRFAASPAHVATVVTRFHIFLFPRGSTRFDGLSNRSIFESARLLRIYVYCVNLWVKTILDPSSADGETNAVRLKVADVECAVLFLLSCVAPVARTAALKIAKLLENIPPPQTNSDEIPQHRLIDLLSGKVGNRAYLDGLEIYLENNQKTRLDVWRNSVHSNMLLRMAESKESTDHQVWKLVFPSFVKYCWAHRPDIITPCREKWCAAAFRYHNLVMSISGVPVRPTTPNNANRPPGLALRDREKVLGENAYAIEQWHMWVKLVCSIATIDDARPTTARDREHSRATSDVAYDREHLMTTRGLFRYLSPFLEAEQSTFRDTAVMCISSFPSSGYSQLLEDLNTLSTRFFYDDPRAKAASPPSGRRNRAHDRAILAITHIYQLTAHHLKAQRGLSRQDALTNVLKYVRRLQQILSSLDNRGDWQLQRIRRYFCGIVGELFDGLATLQSSDRFIPAHMHLTLYRLCEEWCHFGTQREVVMQRLVNMQKAATASFTDPQMIAAAIERFQTETRVLSHAAAGAMASLCQKAFYPPDMSSTSPTDSSTADFLIPLEVTSTLDRIVAMLASIYDEVWESGRKALRSLLMHHPSDGSLLTEVLRRAVVATKDPPTSNCRFFEIVVDVICNAEVHLFDFSHILWLGLVNLCNPQIETRQLAFGALQAMYTKVGGLRTMITYESAVRSPAVNVYLGAQQEIVEFLAGQGIIASDQVLSQFSLRLSLVHDTISDYVSARALQSLSAWITNLDLMDEINSSISQEGVVIIYHLISLTMKYSDNFPEQIQVLWTQLVSGDYSSNGHATIRFLLEQSSAVGSSVFVNCARKIVAYLSRTPVGRLIYEDLCGVIEPARMLPTMDHKLKFPSSDEADMWSELDALFAEQPRHTLGTGQFAMLFLADVALPQAWECKSQLATLLHVVFVHIDHRNPVVREHARRLLFQLLRSWMPGYDELADHSLYLSQFAHRDAITQLEKDSTDVFWVDEDPASRVTQKMKTLCTSVIAWLEPLHPNLVQEWGALAMHWGAACSIRPIAFRSLQVFRSLMPKVTRHDIAVMIGRLSNTMAASDSNILSFTTEIIATMAVLTEAGALDSTLLPGMFWCAYACLSTPNESEFRQVVDLLDHLLDRIDLDNPETADVIASHRPPRLKDRATGLQPLLLKGMRSSTTTPATFRVLKRLAKLNSVEFIDPSGGRVRDMYTLVLPWCLQAMEDHSSDESLLAYATQLSQHAEADGKPNIARVMTSFVKSRFRTKDDFLRQGASALREYYATNEWPQVITLLMGLVLNSQPWLQAKTMQILKVLFQLRETRSPVDKLGSELLMPLLRLIPTDLAPQALDVLEEPVAISGGLAAKHVLRMSMHMSTGPYVSGTSGEMFGMPEPSGWSIARPQEQKDICRSGLISVFDTFKIPSRLSEIEFEPEVDRFTELPETSPELDLGDMVQDLHELSAFFQDDEPKANHTVLHSYQLEARVAAILAKSSSDSIAADYPPTPLTDVFKVSHIRDLEDSDEDSDSDYEDDAFGFDTMPEISVSHQYNMF